MAGYNLGLKYKSSRYNGYGDYFVREEFNVSHSNSTEQIDGWVLQYITKQLDIKTDAGITLNDTDSIMAFTNKQV